MHENPVLGAALVVFVVGGALLTAWSLWRIARFVVAVWRSRRRP